MKVGIFQEADGSFSMRRVLAFLSWLFGAASSVIALRYVSAGWIAFIPAMAFLLFALMMLFFTTWADLKEIVLAAKGIKDNA